MVLKLTGFDIHNILGSMQDFTPKMFDLAFRKYVVPDEKGESKMGKKMKELKGMMPMLQGMMPPMPSMPGMDPFGWFGGKNKDKEEKKSQKNGFDFDTTLFWEQMIDAQKSTMDSSRDQWDQFFAHMMEMQDTFTDALPDEAPSLPSIPFLPVVVMSPKAFMKKVKEFQEMANDHLTEQFDSFGDFMIQGQKQACKTYSENAEKKEKEEKEEKEEVQEAEEKA